MLRRPLADRSAKGRHEPPTTNPAALESAEWTGPGIRYDLVKEFVIALVVVTALVVVLAILSPRRMTAAVTIQQWARTDPADFVTTAVTELDGSSEIAAYGPPYNHTPEPGRRSARSTCRVPRACTPINTAQDFVLNPLRSIPGNAALTQALQAYEAAPRPSRQPGPTPTRRGSTAPSSQAGSLSCPPATTAPSHR